MKKSISFYLLFFLFFSLQADSYVSYELSPGRFGDHLSNYLHAKWVSSHTELPLIFSPFEFSDYLHLSDVEKFKSTDSVFYKNKIIFTSNKQLKEEIFNDTLYFVPHFTTFSTDCVYQDRTVGAYQLIDWRDKSFLTLARELVSLKSKESFAPEINKERVAVALHIRDGGAYDPANHKPSFPLRFLPLESYFRSLSALINYLSSKPLTFVIFSDAVDRDALKRKIEDYLLQNFPNLDVEIQISVGDVLEDFFSLTEFEYIVGPESLFSYNAAKLGKCLLFLKPQLFGVDQGRQPIHFQVAQDLSYKENVLSKTLRYDVNSGDFLFDLREVLKRLWFAYREKLYCDITLSHPMYSELQRSFFEPLSTFGTYPYKENENDSEIDWNDPIFCSLAREVWAPKRAFNLSVDSRIPSIALYFSNECITKYLELSKKRVGKDMK